METNQRAFMVRFTTADGRTSYITKQGIGLTAKEALRLCTEYVRDNLLEVIEVSPIH